MRNPTDARLTVLRAMAREHVGDITTRMVQQLYVRQFGPGDWRGKARQDLAQLTGEGLLICDDTDLSRRVHRFNHAKGPMVGRCPNCRRTFEDCTCTGGTR